MLHTWYCISCDKEYYTTCFSFHQQDGKMVSSHEILSYRKQLASSLCSDCFIKLETNPDPVFELYFKLKEKQSQLSDITQSLELFYQNRVEKTPEVEARLKHRAEDIKKYRESSTD